MTDGYSIEFVDPDSSEGPTPSRLSPEIGPSQEAHQRTQHEESGDAPPIVPGDSDSVERRIGRTADGDDYCIDHGSVSGGRFDRTCSACQYAEIAAREKARKPKSRKIVYRRASEIVPKRARFLWADRIPLGMLTILAGQGGIGKSTTADHLAAQVSRGTLPGEYEGQPRNVIVCAVEDSWAELIVPRLMAAGADQERIYEAGLEDVSGKPAGTLSLPDDVDALEQMIVELDAALVVLSPLVSQLGKHHDAHVAKDVRDALEPLTRLAERTGVAIVGIIHPNKSGSTDPHSLISMSGAFQEVARCVLLAMRDPDDPEGAVLGVSKSNVGKRGNLLGYRLEAVQVDVSDGTTTVPRVLWGDPRPGQCEDVLRALKRGNDDRTTRTREAAEWLWGYLAMRGGIAPSEQIKEDGERAPLEFTAQTLNAARKMKGIESHRESAPKSRTFWLLPDRRAKRDDGEPAPVTITPVDPESARAYDGPGRAIGPDVHGRWIVVGGLLDDEEEQRTER